MDCNYIEFFRISYLLKYIYINIDIKIKIKRGGGGVGGCECKITNNLNPSAYMS